MCITLQIPSRNAEESINPILGATRNQYSDTSIHSTRRFPIIGESTPHGADIWIQLFLLSFSIVTLLQRIPHQQSALPRTPKFSANNASALGRQRQISVRFVKCTSFTYQPIRTSKQNAGSVPSVQHICTTPITLKLRADIIWTIPMLSIVKGGQSTQSMCKGYSYKF